MSFLITCFNLRRNLLQSRGDCYVPTHVLVMLYSLLLVSSVLIPSECEASLERGAIAYRFGVYAEAYSEWLPHAEQGDSQAQYLIGTMYSNGKGVRRDDVQAVYWYRKAAVQGHIVSQTNLGMAYTTGEGVQRNYTQAITWYRKAANQGGMVAQLLLGTMYANGDGVQQDYVQAAAFFRRAAEQGNTDAQSRLGFMYYSGQGVRKDYIQASGWLRKAAEQGDSNAQFKLGGLYYLGQGVGKNYTHAANWFRKAAEQGHYDAQYNLGVMYLHGQGVQKDYAQASDWFRKAAEQGHYDAQYNLGVMYQLGKGVRKDYAQAKNWYRKARDQGSPDAVKALKSLNESIARNERKTRSFQELTPAEKLVGGALFLWLAADAMSNSDATGSNSMSISGSSKCRSLARERIATCSVILDKCNTIGCSYNTNCNKGFSGFSCANTINGSIHGYGEFYCDTKDSSNFSTDLQKVINRLCSE